MELLDNSFMVETLRGLIETMFASLKQVDDIFCSDVDVCNFCESRVGCARFLSGILIFLKILIFSLC